MRTRHGDARKGQVARLHNIWRDVLKRCNPKSNTFAIECYAARGIFVCQEWQDSYVVFKEWAVANGYAESLTLERNDNDGPYSPGNCSWVEWKAQCRNRRNTRRITVGEKTQALAAWLEETGVTRASFHYREKRGWPLQKALGIPDSPQSAPTGTTA